MTTLTVLSFGAGQDSTAILYKLAFDAAFRARYAPGELLVVMSDTGDEHPRTYQHVREIRSFCEEQGIEFQLLTRDRGYHLDKWPGLREFYQRTNTIGSKAFPKTCTDKLKIRPIYAFLEDWVHARFDLAADGIQRGRKRAIKHFAQVHGRIRVLIGIAKGEEKRVADHSRDPRKWWRDSIDVCYPLVDIGLDRAGCQSYIDSIGRKVPPPSNCMLCPFMSKVELLWLARHHPEDYRHWVQLEQNKLDANAHMGDRNLGVWGSKTLPEVLVEAEAEHGHMTDEELEEYKMSHGHCVASKY